MAQSVISVSPFCESSLSSGQTPQSTSACSCGVGGVRRARAASFQTRPEAPDLKLRRQLGVRRISSGGVVQLARAQRAISVLAKCCGKATRSRYSGRLRNHGSSP